jgi:hypothetical protein
VPVPGLCQKELQGPEMLGNLGARMGAPAGVPPIPGGKSPQRLPEAGPGLFGCAGKPAAAAAAGGFAEGFRRRDLGTGRSYAKGSLDTSA